MFAGWYKQIWLSEIKINKLDSKAVGWQQATVLSGPCSVSDNRPILRTYPGNFSIK